MIPFAVSSFFHTFVIFYFQPLLLCCIAWEDIFVLQCLGETFKVKHSNWWYKSLRNIFFPCFCGFCVSILLHVQGLRDPNRKTKLLWINAATQCCCARRDLLHLLRRGVSKNCEKQQPTTSTTLRLTHLPLRSSLARVWIWATIPSAFLQLYSDGNRLIEQALWAGNGRHPRDCMFSHRD